MTSIRRAVFRNGSVATVALCVIMNTGNAQSSNVQYPVVPSALPDSEEVTLAMSAAPAEISGRAEIYTVKDGHRVRIRTGTNGCACMVARDLHRGSAYPICFDVEGSRTLLWQQLMELELRAKGKSESEVQKAVRNAYETGQLKKPDGMTVAYMMSPQQVLYSSPEASGRKVGAWWPHLMIHHPSITRQSLGLPEAGDAAGFSVSDEGGRQELIVKLPVWSDGTPVAPRPGN